MTINHTLKFAALALIDARLERHGSARPNRTLQSVTVGEQDLTMVWHIETPRSRSSEE